MTPSLSPQEHIAQITAQRVKISFSNLRKNYHDKLNSLQQSFHDKFAKLPKSCRNLPRFPILTITKGSILGPVLFILMVNYLPYILNRY